MSKFWRGRLPQGLAALASILIVVACGGGVGSGGTGAASVTLGTVTGFGSIVIDGVAFDDRNASVDVEDRPGTSTLAEAKIGQRIEVEFEVDAVAQSVHVESEVRGVVSAVGAGGLTILRQTIVVNADPASGPVTQFADGYTSLADVRANDVAEVHGVPKLQGGGFVIQATRIEKKAALPAYVRVAGIVTGLGASGSTTSFTLGGLAIEYGSATVLPAGRPLANGQRVVVLAQPPADAAATVLVASQVRIKERSNGPLEAYIGGVVSSLNASASTFDLGGVTVRFGGAIVDPLPSALADGRYVQVRGRFAADGSLVATRVKVRKLDGEPEAELRGTISDYNAAAQTFTVRGVAVAVNGATILDSCPVAGLANGLFVEISGDLATTGVVAGLVKCESEPAGAVVERSGVAGNVDTNGQTFTLTPSGAPAINVRWTALTFFRDVTPATLAGANVQVEGVFVGGVLVAAKVKPEN